MKFKIKTACLASLFAVGVFTATTAQAQSFLTNGLVAYYSFSGNANDTSGNGNNGTVNGATFTIDRFGYTNSAAFFNSNNISTTFFPPLGTASRTFSLWFNVPNNNQQMTFLDYGGDNVFWGDRFQMEINADGTLALDVSGAAVTVTGAAYKDSRWHQLIVAVPTNALLTTVNIYIDGTLQTVFSYYNNANINTSQTLPLRFGNLLLSDTTDRRWLVGSLDDIRIYNRALSSSEVAGLYLFESAQVVNLNKAVWLSFSNLRNGTNYQVQVSTALSGSFTNYGSPFTATNSTMDYPAYWNVGDWSQLFFRLQALP